jgi:hypothetical protein
VELLRKELWIAGFKVVVRRVIVFQNGWDMLTSRPMKCSATSQAGGQEFQAIYESPVLFF